MRMLEVSSGRRRPLVPVWRNLRSPVRVSVALYLRSGYSAAFSEGRRKQLKCQREKTLDLFAVFSWMGKQWWRPNVRTACVALSLRFSQDLRLSPPFAHNENIKLMSRIVLFFFLSPSKSAEEKWAGNRRSAFLVKTCLVNSCSIIIGNYSKWVKFSPSLCKNHQLCQPS